MSESLRLRMIWLLLFGFILVYLCPIGFRPMIVPDEVRYAEIPREMISTGDWIVPRLNGMPYFEKPVLGYWLTGLSMRAFGQNAFAVRFPSALAAGLSALTVAFILRRSGKDDATALLAALIFLTCFEVVGTGVFAVLDGMLAVFLTIAMAAFYGATQAPRGSRREHLLLALFGACCGLAFLTKGFLAFVVPVVIIVPYMIWAGRWRDLFPMAVIPIIVATLVALPWAIAVHRKAPDFWNYFFWHEHVKRFMGHSAQHKAPVWTYLAAFPVAALPWSVLIPAAMKGMDRPLRQTPLFRYALCWFVFPLLFFSAASGKLLTYILPCFAPFAILMGLGLSAGSTQPRRRFVHGGILILLILFSLILAALVIVQTIGIGGFVPYTQPWKTMVAAAAVTALIICLVMGLKQGRAEGSLFYMALGTLMLMATLQWVLPDDTLVHKAPGELLLRNADRVTAETALVSLEDPLRAVCWFYRRNDVYQLGRGGELTYGFAASPANRQRLLDEAQFRTLVSTHEIGRVILVGKVRQYRKWQKKLPPPIYEDTSGPGGYIFVQY